MPKDKVRIWQRRYITILIFLGSLAVITIGYKFIFTKPVEQTQLKYSDRIPLKIGDWKGTKYPPSKKTREDLKTDDIFIGKYTNSRGQKVSLSMAFLSEKMALHHPERCFIGSGWKEIDKVTESIKSPKSNEKVDMTRVVFQKNGRKFIIMYAYRIGDKLVSSYVYYELARVLGLRRQMNALFYVSTNVTGDMDETITSMKEFAQEVLSALPKPFS